MLVASMIVKAEPPLAEEVARQLGRVPGVTTYGVHKEENIVVVAEAQDEAQLENLAKYIIENFEGAWGVYPTFVASDDEPAGAGGAGKPLPVV
jgi:nitrate reductase NapAB chaperone NapD